MPKPTRKSKEIVDAVHHVGPTLESEEKQTYVPARENRVTREEQAADNDLHIHTLEDPEDVATIEDVATLEDISEARLEDEQGTVEGGKVGAEDEPLHTRLAGDTSSDPHTDLGPETPKPVNQRPKNAA